MCPQPPPPLTRLALFFGVVYAYVATTRPAQQLHIVHVPVAMTLYGPYIACVLHRDMYRDRIGRSDLRGLYGSGSSQLVVQSATPRASRGSSTRALSSLTMQDWDQKFLFTK